MDIVISTILDFGFERTPWPLPADNSSQPLVVHAVAGAGKSTLLRKLLDLLPDLRAYTFGIHDGNTLSGRRIEKYEINKIKPDAFNALDEYLGGDFEIKRFKLILCDPFQYDKPCLNAHFTSGKSKRFGRRTAQLLRKLDFEVESDQFDIVLTPDVWKAEYREPCITFEPEWKQYISAHHACALSVEDIKGATYDETFVVCSSLTVPPNKRHLLYVALTRHRKKLVLATLDSDFCKKLLPPANAPNTPTRSQ